MPGSFTRVFVMAASLVMVSGFSLAWGGEKDRMGEITRTEIPGIAVDQLPDLKSEGARLLLRYCAQCHNLPSPATHSAEEWPRVLARMDVYMKENAGQGHREMTRIKRPTESERLAIEFYLRTNGRTP